MGAYEDLIPGNPAYSGSSPQGNKYADLIPPKPNAFQRVMNPIVSGGAGLLGTPHLAGQLSSWIGSKSDAMNKAHGWSDKPSMFTELGGALQHLPSSGDVENFANKVGITTPEGWQAPSAPERFYDNVGSQVASALATQGRSILTNGLKNAAIRLAPAIAGGVAQDASQESGAGGVGQAASGVAGSFIPFLASKGKAGLGNALKALLRGGATPQEVQDTINQFQGAGDFPTVGQATGSHLAQATETGLATLPGSSGVMKKKAETQLANIGGKVGQMADSLAPGATATNAGRSIQSGITDNFIPAARQTEGQLWDNVSQAIPSGNTFPVNRFLDTLDQLTKGNSTIKGTANAIGGDTATWLNSIKDSATKDAVNGQLPFSAMQTLRSQIGSAIDAEKGSALGSSPKLGALKSMYSALTDDMGGAAQASGPQAQQAFNRAAQFSRGLNDRLDLLSPTINQQTPEQTFRNLANSGKDGATKLQAFMKSLPQEAKQQFAAAKLKELGLATPGNQTDLGDQFSTSTFLTNWNKMSPEFKQALGAAMGPSYAQDLDNIAAVASNIKQGSKVFANPSGTSGQNALHHILLGGALGGEGIGSLLEPHAIPGMVAGTAATLGAANLGAKWMTSPATVRWLATASKASPDMLPGMIANLGQIARVTGDPAAQDLYNQLSNPQQGNSTQQPAQPSQPAAPQQPAAPPEQAPATPATPAAQPSPTTQAATPQPTPTPGPGTPSAATIPAPTSQPAATVASPSPVSPQTPVNPLLGAVGAGRGANLIALGGNDQATATPQTSVASNPVVSTPPAGFTEPALPTPDPVSAPVAASVTPAPSPAPTANQNARVTQWDASEDPVNGSQTAFPNYMGKNQAIAGVTAAVDPSVIQPGSWLYIPGTEGLSAHQDGIWQAHDTGSAVKARTASKGKSPVIDLYTPGQDLNSDEYNQNFNFRVVPAPSWATNANS